jgi:diguanylate cyclase (GGDEF)-like protein/PAS domain S-box-containing protein
MREAVDRVLTTESDDAIDAIVAAAVDRLKRTHADPNAIATLARVGWLAHRQTARAPEPVELGSVSALAEQATDAIIILDDADRIRYASNSARMLFGTGMLDGLGFLDFVEAGERGVAESLLRGVRLADTGRTGAVHADLTMTATHGRVSHNELICRDLRSDATIGGLVITLRDVTGQRRLEQELTRSIFRDRLTDLPNQASFHDALSRAIAGSARPVAVAVLDLNRFRAINEGLGRATGDRVLAAIGHRLQSVAGDNTVTARLGGDEFAILFNPVDDNHAVEGLAARVHACFAHPFQAGADAVSCSASMGVATTVEASTDHEVMRHADLALDAAKVAGAGTWRRYEPSMVEAVQYRTELRSALGHALSDGSLIVHYQPILSLRTSLTVGFEALVRWRHPTRGLLSPAQFIDIAEESELIHAVGSHVLNSAIATAVRWPRRENQHPPYVSVNVSVSQFRVHRFADTVRGLLDRHRLSPNHLVLEITESLLLRDDDQVWEELNRLREWGVRIAIDDFGTGYSALGYLRQVPLDIVKLDRVFVSTVATSGRQRALVAGIVGLVNALGLDVVAEGIETADQRDICEEIGCSHGQGYLFAHPMPAADTAAWLGREVGRAEVA